MPPRRKTAVVLLRGAVITTPAGNSHYAILLSQENGRGLSATMQCTHNTCNIVNKKFLGEHALFSLIYHFLPFFCTQCTSSTRPMELLILLGFILWFLAPAVDVDRCPCCFMFNKIRTALLNSEVPVRNWGASQWGIREKACLVYCMLFLKSPWMMTECDWSKTAASLLLSAS